MLLFLENLSMAFYPQAILRQGYGMAGNKKPPVGGF